MAAVTRQPFAPLNETRLQSLTSLKNRQNALPSPAAGKRKAEVIEVDDSENVDPVLFSKRAKGFNGFADFVKPAPFVLKTTPSLLKSLENTTLKSAHVSRRTIQPKSHAARFNANAAVHSKSSRLAAPAGRSPTHGKRSGLLSSRQRSSPYTRFQQPSFNLGSGRASAPFSLDAALRGTIPGYSVKPKAAVKSTLEDLDAAEMKKLSWFFDIHEDTAEQEMTNLLQHSTCVLDISSDEESTQRAKRESAEGRDKENVSPVDDVSQTSARRAPRLAADEMVVEKERVALGEMNTAGFYAEGCDETSVILVHEDEDQEQPQPETTSDIPVANDFDFAPALSKSEAFPLAAQEDIDLLMGKVDGANSRAAVLQPIDGTGEVFELWESGSNKDDTESPGTPLRAATPETIIGEADENAAPAESS